MRPPPTPRKADRAPPSRHLLVTLYVYAEGKTEQGWVDWLDITFRKLNVRLDCVGQAGVPMTLLARAKAKATELRRPRISSRDEVWIVFDRDAHPNVEATLKEAEDAGVGVVFSNACFELWPLLHLGDRSAHTERDELQRLLHAAHATYDHDCGACVEWRELAADTGAATRRAIQLHARARDSDLAGNPTTTAWLLHERCRLADRPRTILDAVPDDALRAWLRRFLPRALRD